MSKSTESASIKIELADIAETMSDTDRISSEQLVEALNGMADKPWPTFSHGKPITQNRVVRMLKPFGIEPKNIRIGDKVLRVITLPTL